MLSRAAAILACDSPTEPMDAPSKIVFQWTMAAVLKAQAQRAEALVFEASSAQKNAHMEIHRRHCSSLD
jgi:hypothetical protein